jgi:hypothetical protein
MRIAHLLASLLIASTGIAYAAGDHGHGHENKPQHGGVLAEANDMEYELVAKPERITLHVRDHGKPANTQGMTAKLTLLNGAEKSEVLLAPAVGGALEAKGSFKVVAGTKAVALVTLSGKKAANLRFAIR